MSSTAIFIPAYQAEATLASVVERIPKAFWPRVRTLIVVDDGSSDGTSRVAEQLADRYPAVRLERLPVNRGYGGAVRRGLELARASAADYLVCLHADGQYPPEKLPEFVDHMERGGIDLLQGSRHKEGTALGGGMPRYKWLAGKLLTWLENQAFGLEMTDYHSGFLLYSRRAVEEIPFDTLSPYFDFDLEVIACARARGLAIGERAIPTRYADEVSYLNPVRYGLRCLSVLARFKAGKYDP